MESTLSLSKSQLEAKVGTFLGAGRGSEYGDSAWTSRQSAEITDCVESGIRQFYFPPPIEGASSSYEWSFLKPTSTLSLASGASTINLPDDFGGLDGEVTLTSPSSSYLCPIPHVGEGVVRQKFAELPDATGSPQVVAIVPIKGTSKGEGQRWQLYFWPAADQAYTLKMTYFILPDALSGQRPYCYGGMQHAETILESCLAIAEQRRDDAVSVHSAKFKERLAASISMDRRMKPQKLGYNADRSDAHWLDRLNRRGETVVTFDGVAYP